MTHTLSLGSLVLLGAQQGPYIHVTIDGCDGHISMTLAQWTGLQVVADVLGAVDKEMERLRGERDALDVDARRSRNEADHHRRLYDQLGEELEQIVGGDGTSMERLRRLEKERDAYRAAAADLLAATHGIDNPSQSLIAYRAQVRDLLKNGPETEQLAHVAKERGR